MDSNTTFFGSSEGETRRRAISNISKIVTNLRSTRHGQPARAESAGIYEDEVRHGGFFLPHERRRHARSDPYAPQFEDYMEHTASRRHQWRKGRRLAKRTFTARTTDGSGRASTIVTWTPDDVTSGHIPLVHWASEEQILEPFSRGALKQSVIAEESVISESQQPTTSRTTTPRSSSNIQRRSVQVDQSVVSEAASSTTQRDPASPAESTEIAPPEDPASGLSNGGYASSCDGEGGDNRVTFADRLEVQQLRSEMMALKKMQERNYMLLNSSLQEHFQTTGALENRLDEMKRARMNSPGTTSTLLMWTILDAVSSVILWLINVIIAKPYDVVRRSFLRRDKEEDSVSRKSWRLDSGTWDHHSHDFTFAARKSWRFEPGDAEAASLKLSKARRLSVSVGK